MDKEDKKTRTIRLTQSMDARLIALCDHLGTNVNAFLITKIGEIVSTSELAFKAQQNSNEMLGLVSQMFATADEDLKEVKQKAEQQLSLDQDL